MVQYITCKIKKLPLKKHHPKRDGAFVRLAALFSEFYGSTNFPFAKVLSILKRAISNKMNEILKILKDTEILVSWQKSPNFFNIAKKTKFQPVVVKAEKINDVLNILQNSFVRLKELADNRRTGGFSPEIPEFKLQ